MYKLANYNCSLEKKLHCFEEDLHLFLCFTAMSSDNLRRTSKNKQHESCRVSMSQVRLDVGCTCRYIFYKIACKRCNKYTMFLFFYSLLITSFKSAEGGKICKLAISYLIFYMELTVLVFSWFKKNKKTKTVELRMC